MTKTRQKKRHFGVLDREKSRKDAVRAVKMLQKIRKDAEADLSVREWYVIRLGAVLEDDLEPALSNVFDTDSRSDSLRVFFEEDDLEEEQATVEQHESQESAEGPAGEITGVDSAQGEDIQ